MPTARIDRPVVRSFIAKYEKNAAAWAKRGGHAIVWYSDKSARLVVRAPKESHVGDLGYWAMLDLGKSSWRVAMDGALLGLGFITVPADCMDIVRGWCTRDSIHEGPTRALELDCLECGACCRSNEVILSRVDIKRFRDGGRPELAKLPSARRRKDGKLVLRLLSGGDCRNLGRDNKCAIYTLRPASCSDFPMGSECCLFAREEELGLLDGARNEAGVP